MHVRKVTRRGIATLMAIGICAACASRPGSSATTGGQLVWGKRAEVAMLDPARTDAATSWELLLLTYEGLVGLDDDLKPVPELATSWRQTSPITYVFDLREGVKFSNGRALTADDVVGSFERIQDPKLASIWRGQLGMKNVTAVGPSQVKFTLVKPKTSFLAALAGTPAKILPMRELDAGTFDPKKTLMGTGPYKVASHVQNESWTFVRNPYYWRPGTPKAARLTVRIMPDESARAAALRDGRIDFTSFETPDTIRLLKGQAGVKTVVQSTTDYYRLDVNATSSVFRDERLRQALALSIDRNQIRDVALGGVGNPTAAVAPAFGVCDPASVPFSRPDPARARALVAAAGATGKPVDIGAMQIVTMASPIAQVLQRDLVAAGLKAHVTNLELGNAVKRAYSGDRADFDMIVTWYAGYGDPAMVLPWWNPELAVFNKSFLKPDPELDKLIDTSVATPPGPARTGALRDTCGRIAQDANVIPLVSKNAIVAYRPDRVTPVIPRVEGYAVPLRHIADFSPK